MIRELCLLHNVALPSEVDSLTIPVITNQNPHNSIDDPDPDSDVDEIEEDPIEESEQESEVEDIPIEMVDERQNASSKVGVFILIILFLNL